MIVNCIETVIGETYGRDEEEAVEKLEVQLQCLHRLFASKSGFQAFSTVNG